MVKYDAVIIFQTRLNDANITSREEIGTVRYTTSLCINIAEASRPAADAAAARHSSWGGRLGDTTQ